MTAFFYTSEESDETNTGTTLPFSESWNDVQDQCSGHSQTDNPQRNQVENPSPTLPESQSYVDVSRDIHSLPVREIVINKNNVLKDMVNEFLAQDIIEHKVEILFKDERGNVENGRGSGLFREALSIFWREFSVSLSVGVEEKVPLIHHDYQRAEWESIARVIVVGVIQANYFPISLSLAFFVSALFGEESVSRQFMIESFYKYVSKDECETLKKCETDAIDAEDEDLVELLNSYKCFRVPTNQSMPNIIFELAHQELIQKPKYIANAWSPIIGHLKNIPEFKDIKSVKEMYTEKKPTAKKIIKLLDANPSNDAERNCFDHLKRYIKLLDESLLTLFLQFITGSNVISCDKIDLGFNAISGELRTPTAHTCGPLLVVSSTYQTYNELSEEFTNILRLMASWSFVIV